MSAIVTRRIVPVCLVLVGVALAGAGIYVGDSDDSPGAALIGIVLMIAAIVGAIWLARRT